MEFHKQIEPFLQQMEFGFKSEADGQCYYFYGENKMDNADISTTIVCDEELNLLVYLSWISVRIPQEKRSEVLEKINEIHNNTTVNACLYLDEENNLSVRAVLNVSEEGLDEEKFKYMLWVPILYLDDCFKDIMVVAYGHPKVPLESSKEDLGRAKEEL